MDGTQEALEGLGRCMQVPFLRLESLHGLAGLKRPSGWGFWMNPWKPLGLGRWMEPQEFKSFVIFGTLGLGRWMGPQDLNPFGALGRWNDGCCARGKIAAARGRATRGDGPQS